MSSSNYNFSNKRVARFAGFLYLLVVVNGIFSILYVPSQLIVWDDAAITLTNITENEFLFRMGIVSGLICYISFLLLPLALYKLLEFVNRDVALLMVFLVVASVPVSYLNLVNKLDVLSLTSNAEYLKALDASQLQFQMMSLLESYSNGVLIALIFWGLWLFPFGYLVFKSKILPRFFGICLMLGCFGYLIDFAGVFFFPDYGKTLVPTIVGIPASIGEIGICFWLLIMGAKERGTSD